MLIVKYVYTDTIRNFFILGRPRSFAYNQNQRNNLANANNVSGSATPAGTEFEPTTKGKGMYL